VEVFGWLVLAEGVVVLLAPHLVASALRLPPLAQQAADYFRLVGLLACGIGILYMVSGRLNADGFVTAALLDRPLVPPVMAVLWLQEVIPGPLALVISLQDLGGVLWTFAARRADRRAANWRAVEACG
jgi:hypothetical protein